MFIAIDIGNTNITVSILEKGKWQEHRISSEAAHPLTYYTQQLASITKSLNLDHIQGVGVSSVVPHLTNLILDATALKLHSDPLLFSSKYYQALPIATPNPEELGTDLMANALAGFTLANGPCLIVDFGTALTYTLVNNKHSIEGVAIAPGIRTSMESLFNKAAQLPEIQLHLPDKPLGMNTAEAMSAGILWGFVGQVDYLVEKILNSVNYPVTTIATGGLSHVLKPLKNQFDIIDRNLTVKGIYEFFKLVRGNPA